MVAHIIAARIENFEHNKLPKNVRVHSPTIAAPNNPFGRGPQPGTHREP